MTARLKEIRKTLETSNMMSGSRYIVAWFSLIFILNMHVMMAKNIDRFKRFTKKDVCNGTVFSFVEMCPESEKDYQERSEKISCESYPPCLGKPLVYHCVRLEVELVEVCAPRNQIIGRCCPVYDRRLGRVREDYNSPCSECPFKYQSDDTVKYVSCVKKAQTVNGIPKLNKLTNVTANSNISGSTSSPCCKGARCKRNVDGCTEQTPTNKNNKPKSLKDIDE